MNAALDKSEALSRLKEGIARVQNTVRSSSYGLRVAGKRLGDLTAKGGPLVSAAKTSAEEMKKLSSALERPEEDLTEAAVLAYFAHFGEFVRALTGQCVSPGNPESASALEELFGASGALKKAPQDFSIFLALAGVAVRGGKLDRRAFDALGREEVELKFQMGKVLLFMEGDRVSLTGKNLEDIGGTIMETAKILIDKTSAK